MPIESGNYISDLDASNPSGEDHYATADDHLRLIKEVLLKSFPNVTGQVNASDIDLNKLENVNFVITSIQSSIAKLYSSTLKVLQDVDDLSVDYQLVIPTHNDISAKLDVISADLSVLSSNYSGMATRLYSLSISAVGVVEQTFYAGRIDADGTAIRLPDDWESIKVATDEYHVSHYLAIPTTYSVCTDRGVAYSLQHYSFRVNASSSFSFFVAI